LNDADAHNGISYCISPYPAKTTLRTKSSREKKTNPKQTQRLRACHN